MGKTSTYPPTCELTWLAHTPSLLNIPAGKCRETSDNHTPRGWWAWDGPVCTKSIVSSPRGRIGLLLAPVYSGNLRTATCRTDRRWVWIELMGSTLEKMKLFCLRLYHSNDAQCVFPVHQVTWQVVRFVERMDEGGLTHVLALSIWSRVHRSL